MNYIKRIIEEDLYEKLSASGAVLIKGPKSCGKTTTAKQFAKSVLEMDRDKQVPVIMATNPQLLIHISAHRHHCENLPKDICVTHPWQ